MATKFERYEAVRRSGVTNMFALETVMALSGLTKADVLDIMTHYAEYKARAEAEDEVLFCEKCGGEMSEDDPHSIMVDEDQHFIICQNCKPVQTTDVGRFCDRCGVATSDANPVSTYQSDRFDVYGDPQPPETTYLCEGCIAYAQIDDSDIPY